MIFVVLILGIVVIAVSIPVFMLGKKTADKGVLKTLSDVLFGEQTDAASARGRLPTPDPVVLPPDKRAAIDMLLAYIIDCHVKYRDFKQWNCAEIFTHEMGGVRISKAELLSDANIAYLKSQGVSDVEWGSGEGMITFLGRTRDPVPLAVLCYYSGAAELGGDIAHFDKVRLMTGFVLGPCS